MTNHRSKGRELLLRSSFSHLELVLLGALTSFFLTDSCIVCTTAFGLVSTPHCPNNKQPFTPPSTTTALFSSAEGSSNTDESDLTEATSSSAEPPPKEDKYDHHVVIVGGGWAGFAAADALSSYGRGKTKITLLDASPRGKGGLAGGWRTPKTGRPVEAGIHGFWRDYTNVFAVLQKRLNLALDDILTPYTPSVLYSESGLVSVAPVLVGDDKDDKSGSPSLMLADILRQAGSSNSNDILKPVAALLPPPLDLALLAEYNTENNDNPLTLQDRISAIGLLGAWADFGQEDSDSWSRYDKISAEDLFLTKSGVTPNLYREMVLPLLHVLPMTTGYDCSAAAALSCFHVFALASRGAFDVRWCRGSIGEQIFDPWAKLLTSENVEIRGSSKVSSIEQVVPDDDATTDASTTKRKKLKISLQDNTTSPIVCDSVVLAVGGTSMAKLVQTSPVLKQIPMAARGDFDKFRGVTCVAVRLFLKPHSTVTRNLKGGQYDATELPPNVAKAMQESPVAVCGPNIGTMPILKEIGFCIYDLQRLQDEFAVDNNKNDDNRVAVLEVDFFRADAIADIQDNDKVAYLALDAVAAALKTGRIDSDQIVDVSVVRARNAVSHFCVNSVSYCPPVRLAPNKGVYMCGDWIDRTGHASWSTEKAVVTGRQAAEAVLEDFKIKATRGSSSRIEIIPAPTDTQQLSALRQVAKLLRQVAPPPGDGVPMSSWSFVKSALSQRRS